MKLALITLAVFYGCILTGIIYQYCLIQGVLFSRIRLNNDSPNPKEVHHPMKLVTLNLILLTVLTFSALYFSQGFFIITLPSIGIFIVQFLLYLFFDDLGFYIWHRALHKNRFLLQKVHSIHHRIRRPVPLEFIYVHPIEWMLGTLGVIVAALVIIALYGQVNTYVLWAYIVFRTLHELDIHSNTRSVIFRRIPFFGTVEHHDTHHQHAAGNYASTFTYLDKLFGTETETLPPEKKSLY